MKPAQKAQIRSLLRALLRECTYLPDSAARTYMREYVLSRFRTRLHRPLLKSDLAPRLKSAKLGLKLLRQANEGVMSPLTKVLAYTYGRRGKRRHDLLKELLQADDPPVPAMPISPETRKQRPTMKMGTEFPHHLAQEPEIRDSKMVFHLANRYSKLKALVRSQSERASLAAREARIPDKSVRLEVPKKNIWSRPMPQRRINNMVRQWYGKLLEQVLPPLPEPEWMRLQGLAYGSISWEGIKKRRPKGTVIVKKRRSKRTVISRHNSEAVAGAAVGPPLRASLGIDQFGTWDTDGRRAHIISHRFMRRLWIQILGQSPLAKWDSGTGQWSFGWDPGPFRLTLPTAKVPLLFSGVDEKGAVISKTSSSGQIEDTQARKSKD